MDQIPMHENIVYWVNLPQFILNFKFKVVNFILPHLFELKRMVNDQENSKVVNPFVIVMTLLVSIIVLKNIWNLLFEKGESTGQSTESKEMTNEVNELKKQLKSLKVSFHQLTKQLNKKHISSSESQINSHQQVSSTIGSQQQSSNQTLVNLLKLYNLSLEQNKSLINYVLESQCQVLKQLKRFKKLNKNSISSSGRPSMSTVRSKTTQKKLLTKDQSLKKVVNSSIKSQVKKIQVKTVQKQFKTQVPIKRINEPSPKILKEQQKQQKQQKQKITPQIMPQILNKNRLPVRMPKRPISSSVPDKHIFQTFEKQTTFKQEIQQSQQIITPVTMPPKNSLIQSEVKVQVQTSFKETQFTQIIEPNDQFQTNFQEFSSTETKIQTIEQKSTTIDPNTPQNEEFNTRGEEVIIVAPLKLPQFKKTNVIPGGIKGVMKRPPPPPSRK